MTPLTIEDLILSNDRRGISQLRDCLPVDFCSRAASLLYQNYQRVLIVTGFYLLNHQASETDGPAGAAAIGRAVQRLGGQVWYVIEPCLAGAMHGAGIPYDETIIFPILPVIESRAVCATLLADLKPTLVISVEHCSITANGRYLNSRGLDISSYTAKPDALFEAGIASIGIGDGGNEIGMGNLAQYITTIASLPREPAATRVDELIIASISNWGAYGLVAALSNITGQNLLPSVADEYTFITRLYESGCVDGLQSTPALGVDGFSMDAYLAVLAQLHARLDYLP